MSHVRCQMLLRNMNKTSSKTQVFLSLGSNVDDRMAHLAMAEEKLENHPNIKILKKSEVYETEPWPLHGIEGAPDDVHPVSEEGEFWFLNKVVKIETSIAPLELLDVCQEIESDIGRSPAHKWGPREIDVDILLFGQEVIDLPELTIPHHHLNDRQFVLVPLLEVEPDLKDPVSGKTYKYFLKNIKDNHKVEPYF